MYQRFVGPTDTQWERAVPCPSLPPQAGEYFRAFQCVAWVTTVRHSAPSKMPFILFLVAKMGDTGVLTFDQLET